MWVMYKIVCRVIVTYEKLMNSTMENLRRDEQAYNESVNDKQVCWLMIIFII